MAVSIEKIAELLLHARQTGVRIASAEVGEPPGTAAEAYAVQDIVARHLWRDHGGRATAWKVGASSRDAMPTAAPMSPPVYDSPATLSAAKLGIAIVEMELAYVFGRDLPLREAAYSIEEASAAVESIHAAIEMVDTRLSDRETAPGLLKLADNQSHGAFVLGEGSKVWRKIDPRDLNGILRINGKVQERFQVAHPLGNPAVLLPWFAAHLGQRGGGFYGGVKKGDVLTTGMLNQPVNAKAGDVVIAEFLGLGSATIAFTA